MEKLGNDYYSEVIKDELHQKKRLFTILTKNDRGEIVSVNQVEASVNSVLGEEIYNNFNAEAKG